MCLHEDVSGVQVQMYVPLEPGAGKNTFKDGAYF